MNAFPLLNPKRIEIVAMDGSTRAYDIGKFPALAGREIVTLYPLTAVPKMGSYEANRDVMLKMLAYVEVPAATDASGRETAPPIRLNSPTLIDNHVPDFETLYKIEFAIVEYNCSFFQNGKGRSLLESLVTNLTAQGMSALTKWLPQLLQAVEQRSKS